MVPKSTFKEVPTQLAIPRCRCILGVSPNNPYMVFRLWLVLACSSPFSGKFLQTMILLKQSSFILLVNVLIFPILTSISIRSATFINLICWLTNLMSWILDLSDACVFHYYCSIPCDEEGDFEPEKYKLTSQTLKQLFNLLSICAEFFLTSKTLLGPIHWFMKSLFFFYRINILWPIA